MEVTKEQYEGIAQKYGQLTGTGLEKKVTEAFGEAVKKSITDSQRYADAVMNLIAPRRVTRKVDGDEAKTEIVEVPADYGQAKEALEGLAKSVGPVVEHWRPFIELACEALEVDVRGMLPRQMVPNPLAFEKALAERTSELDAEMKRNTGLEVENVELKKRVEQATKNMETALNMQSQAEAVLGQTQAALADARKAQAELAAENEAMKGQLEAAKKPHDSKAHGHKK